jgi:D-beta-D-heptose 7-phosphate kinase/D-beta-D-heptose 1-phosphate adenosyltransferase
MKRKQKPLAKILGKFSGQTVGVLGDFMLDELLRGEATRISPEAPVPVILMDGHPEPQRFPGGAGNVAINVRALGARSVPFGAIGVDESGDRLCKELKARGVPPGTLVREPGRITPRKLRIVAHQHQLLRLDFEKPAPISPRTSVSIGRSFARWAPKLSALIISDYRKGSVETELCGQVLSVARQLRIPVFVDPKPEHPEICHHATAVTPNLHEAELMAGHSMRDRASLETGGRRLLAELDCDYLLITRGAEGMTLFAKGGAVHNITSEARPVYDVTGAGDTVLAVLALAFASGAKMADAARLANLAAGRVVLRFGTSEVSPQELLTAINDAA